MFKRLICSFSEKLGVSEFLGGIFRHFYQKLLNRGQPPKIGGNVAGMGGFRTCQKYWSTFFCTFYHFRLIKSAGRKNSVQKPHTVSEAKK